MINQFDLFDKFWLNKRVLVTGHTGFKGSWLYYWLNLLGAEVHGIGLAPNTSPNLFEGLKLNNVGFSKILNIRNFHKLADHVAYIRPEIVFHLAAQPLVSAGYENPIKTFDTNIMGTANLLQALINSPSLQAVVIATTDKVYKNSDENFAFREGDELGGHDPYSASKAASELIIKSYADSFFSSRKVAISTARAGNVIGGGDWAKNRIIPDAIRSWSSGKPLIIRNPNFVRPWQHVIEPIYAYLKIAQQTTGINTLAGSYNVGPDSSQALTVIELVEIAQKLYGGGLVVLSENKDQFHESKALTLNTDKLRRAFGISPYLNNRQSLELTVNWYKEFSRGSNPCKLCENNIIFFKKLIDAR